MHSVIFEVRRRPEVPIPNTEALVLTRTFKDLEINSDIFTNDLARSGHYPGGVSITRQLIAEALSPPDVDVVHWAVHGSRAGLVLSWQGPIDFRTPRDMLLEAEIRHLHGLEGRLVVSGACLSGGLARAFLAAGANAYVAPRQEIPWANLGSFFAIFYGAILSGMEPRRAVRQAIDHHPDLAAFHCYVPRNRR